MSAPISRGFFNDPGPMFQPLEVTVQNVDSIWVFPKIGVPQNGWFLMENTIKMDDLGVALFSETSI